MSEHLRTLKRLARTFYVWQAINVTSGMNGGEKQFKNKGKQISYQHSVISCQRSAVSLEGDFGLREIDWVGQNPP